MKSLIASKWLNIVLFNLFWIGCVAGKNQLIWLVAPFAFLYLFLLIYYKSITLRQVALTGLLGITIDSILTAAGFFQFAQDNHLIPPWLIVLWFVFVTTLPLSLDFLTKHKRLTILAGATGFPFSYAMGERLGAVTFGSGYLEALVFLSIIWAAGLPLLFHLNRHISKARHVYT